MASDKDKGAGEPRITDQSELKPVQRKALTTYEPIRTRVTKTPVVERSLYWFGALPVTGEFEWKIPVKEYNEETNDYSKLVKTTSEKLWFPRDNRHPRIWRGKCAFFKGLTVSGLTFPGYTESALHRGEGQESRIAWPGAIKPLMKSQVDRILRSVMTWVIRAGGTMANLATAERGEHDTLDTSNPNTVAITPPVNAEYGDTPVAEYVYLVRLSAPIDTPKTSYWKLVPEMSEFFKAPPPALAQPVEVVSP